MKPLTVPGRILPDGNPSPALVNNVTNALRTFAPRGDGDGYVEVEIRPRRRSLSANNYYWGAVVPAVRELFASFGWDLTPDQTHDWLKRTFLGVTVIEVPSADLTEVVPREVVGTTRTDAWTFAEYVEAIKRHEPFAEAGLFIAEPDGQKVTGRTIHEPGGTKVTFRDPSTEPPPPAPDRSPVRTPSAPTGGGQAHILAL